MPTPVTNNEFLLLMDLQSQLKGWLTENQDKFKTKPIQTLVINKIMYYTSTELHLPLTRGWYRYGPCVEKFRAEDELVDRSLDLMESKHPENEVLIKECNSHFAEFFNDRSKYNEKYLEYIYQKRCNFPKIRDVYLTKHALMNALYQQAYDRAFFEVTDIVRKITRFNSAISKQDYVKF